ncbi:MAG: cytidylyltransferase domain-containing protein [Bacteroidia bacterium]
MVENLKITALLTGRGNNTLKDKNILSVLNKPLLGYPCEASRKSEYIQDFYVSSECDKILTTASDYGFSPLRRPKALALPNAQHEDVINHAIEYLIKKNKKPNILVVLLANSVTVKTEWIDACIAHVLKDKQITASVPVYRESDHHPFRAKKVNDQGYLEPFFDFQGRDISTNRQDLIPAFFLSHNFWVLNLDTYKKGVGYKPWTFMGDKVKFLEVGEAFDVHTMEDIERSEKWVKKELL